VYYNVYNRITDLLKYSTTIELHEASPKLFGLCIMQTGIYRAEFFKLPEGFDWKDQAQLDGWLRDGSAAYVESMAAWG
jgi:hypothetical protein